jgi:hypothetical protein
MIRKAFIPEASAMGFFTVSDIRPDAGVRTIRGIPAKKMRLAIE